MQVIGDAEVSRLPALAVIETIQRAVLAHDAGQIDAPARINVALPLYGDARLLFTVGGTPSAVGFRVYANGADLAIQQAVMVHDRTTGELLGVIEGYEFGARRTAALGAVAARALARPDASVVGMIGSGFQAFAHLWALSAVRQLREVRVYSRDRDRREAFARRCQDEIHVPCHAVLDARTSVLGADLVTLATRSTSPVIEADWVAPGAHVATLGPKTVSEHEAPLELAERASAVVTDSYAQLTQYGEPSWLTLASGQLERVRTLGAVIAGKAEGRRSPSDITLFCSVGLAGTEVVLAEEILRRK